LIEKFFKDDNQIRKENLIRNIDSNLSFEFQFQQSSQEKKKSGTQHKSISIFLFPPVIKN